MNTNLNSKFSRFKSGIVFFLLTLVSNAAAASITQQPIGGGLEFLDMINSWLLFPLATYQDLGVFLAIWAGFYYATKPILNEVMSGMLEAFPSIGGDGHSISRNNTSDSVKRSVRGLSLVAGFIAAQYVGWIIGGFMLIVIGSMSFIAIVVYLIWGTNNLYGELTGNGEETRTDGGTTTRSGGSSSGSGSGPSPSGGDIPDELSDDINQMSNAISKLNDRVDEIEAEDRNVMDELKQLKSEVDDLDVFEQQLPEMVEQGKLTQQQAKEVEKLIEDADGLEQLEEDIEKNNEKLLEMEEKVEANEEDIGELEMLIAEMEEKAQEDLANTRQNLNQLRQQNEKVQNQLNQLEKDLDQKVIDRETYERQKAQLQEEFSTIKQEINAVQEQLQHAANEREQIKARIATLEDKMSGTLHVVGDLENRVEELEQEESQAEQMEQKDEQEASSVAGDLPDNVQSAIVGDMEDEVQVLGDEEEETADLETLLEGEEGSLHVEQDTEEDEKAMSEKIDKGFVKLHQAAEQLQSQVGQEAEEFEQVDQQERAQAEREEKSINEIRRHLTEMYQGKTNMSDQQIQQKAEQYLERLQKLKQTTQDDSQLGNIREAINLAKNILDQEKNKMAAEAQTEQETEQLAMEARKFAGALEDPEEKTVVQEVERSFETAEQFLDPRNQKSSGQAEKFIWSQQEYVQQMEQMRKRQMNKGDQQAAQEVRNLEEGFVDVLNKICEIRGIDKSQFGFL
jgi:DNA repair exonuclease SbcCD ATPase subunit